MRRNFDMSRREIKPTREQTDRDIKSRTVNCNRCRAPNWSKQYECPARRKKCVKIGYYAKCCCSSRRINHVAEEDTYTAEEDGWKPDRIHSKQQKLQLLGTRGKNIPPSYSATLVVNNRPICITVHRQAILLLVVESGTRK